MIEVAAKPRWTAWCAAGGAVLGAIGVALGAVAAHGAEGAAAERLQRASDYLLVHGPVLMWLAAALRRPPAWPILLMALGVLLFCGGLVAAALFGWTTRFVPLGGSLLILAWLSLAWAWLRR